MQLIQVTPNTALAVPLDDAKNHLGIPLSDTSSDAEINRLIKAARSFVERETDRILLPEVWQEIRDTFPVPLRYPLTPNWNYTLHRTPLLQYQDQSKITLVLNPVQSVNIQYYDLGNVLQTLDPATYYFVAPTRLPATLTPAQFFPVAYPRPDAVQITCQVGYTSVPDNCAQALIALVATWFQYRESESEKVTKELNAGLLRIINQLRVEQ